MAKELDASAAKDTLHRDWGRMLKECREARGYSQVRLAELTGLNHSTISRIEAGRWGADDADKWLIAGALGVTLRELFPYPAVKPPFPEVA